MDFVENIDYIKEVDASFINFWDIMNFFWEHSHFLSYSNICCIIL